MRQLSLLESARLQTAGASDVDLVEEIAADIVRELDLAPPIDLRIVASFRDIREIRIERLPVAGSLTPEPSGLVMRLARGDTARRQRFTGFHEVGHTFLPGYYDTVSLRCPSTSGHPRAGNDPETLSDAAAAELILPRELLIPALFGDDFGWQGVERLAEDFDASFHATAYRYARFWPEDVLFIVLEPGLRREERGRPDAVPKLRVRTHWSSGTWPYIPKNKSALSGGPLDRALAGEFIDEPASLADLGIDAVGSLRLSARLYPYVDSEGVTHHRVMALYRRVGVAQTQGHRRRVGA